MNSIWNKNLELFKSRFPELFSILKDEVGGSSSLSSKLFTLVTAKNGSITAKEGAATLHSLYNPEREALNAVSAPQVSSKSTCVFYGFGLGYQVIEFCKKYPSKKLVLIEPDPAHLFAALEVLDWSDVFAHQQLALALGCPQESVLSLIEDSSRVNVGNTGVNDAYFFDIPAFTAHAAGYFAGVREIIKRNQRKNEINAATLKKFGRLWVRNSLRNAGEITKREGIGAFKSASSGAGTGSLPFLIIGAGPSLGGIIPYLAELKKRMVIVCVETALRTLLKAGIQPDFIILLDPQFWAWRHIAGLSAPESILITESCAYPSVFRFNCKKIILCKSQFPVGQYFEKKLELDLGDLGTGGSVASAAWNFAHFCGAKSIYTAGLDLSFPAKETHIKGSSAEQTFHTLARRTRTVENFTAGTLFSANASPAQNYLGEKVTTDSRMKMFAWWFEARLAACPEVRTYTLCPQSMKIPGIEACALEEALSLKDISKEKEEFLNKKKGEAQLPPSKRALFEKIFSSFPDQEFFSDCGYLREYF